MKIKIHKTLALGRHGYIGIPQLTINDKDITTDITCFPEVNLISIEQTHKDLGPNTLIFLKGNMEL